ncbi:MAG: DUF349 domain-containing protein [Kofleriaceae bacterium]
MARTDRDIGVRRLALERIDEADILAELAAAETERSLRDFAGERAAQLWTSHACSDDADDASNAVAGIIKLGDQHALTDVVVRAAIPAIRKRAFSELRDPRALADLAKTDAPLDLRTAAVARIDDGDVLRALAIDTVQKEVGLAAVEKLDDVDRLENVAQKAKNKAVRQKARKIVTEIIQAERAKKTSVPDEVKRKRAERAQLIRQVEALADSFEFAKASEQISSAEVAWAKLGVEDQDNRFERAVERFWKRKELHENQTRSAEELRAVEREAARDKERAAAERAAKAADQAAVAEPVEQPGDPKREAREAEAKARREERERQRAEEDARRQAQAAERAAKQQEAVERGAAVAASLEAMCADMEQLAGSDAKDGRTIDRLLSQAAKVFESIGKVAPDKRDGLADRYQAARGKLVIKASDLREAEDWQRWSNVPKAEALIATAKEMAEAPATPDLGNRLRGLQALWKEEVGPMPQRRSKELWEQFKASCDLVYDKVKGVRAVEQEKFAEVTAIKEKLIAEAEALADSTDFATTAPRLKQLQSEWKQSGHLPRKLGDELWGRFRAACDRFFERRKPMLEAQRAEEADNLAKKQALIARAEAITNSAGEGTWGKAIAEIKELQRQWKDIGFVPRRDADAVYSAFRRACDALFAKRDEARDVEANAHRAEIEALKAEIEWVKMGGEGMIERALAVRTKATELGVLRDEITSMVQNLITEHTDLVIGTELDPSRLRAKRDKLIARAEELLPKTPDAPTAGVDIAQQLKQAMSRNAFGDLRFSGRDPVEVIDELRAAWADVGPIIEDHDQQWRFDEIIMAVLEAVRPNESASERGDRGRRRRRERDSRGQPMPPSEPVAATKPATPPLADGSGVNPAVTPEPVRAKSLSTAPPMDQVDTGWDLGDDDPTASADAPADEPSPPSSAEMAGDGATEGEDHSGWD